MATPIPLHQPTQYPSTLALVAIPSFHRLVHHMCAHHTLSHQPLLTFVGMHAPNFNNHPSSIWLSSTLHQPIIFWAPPCPIPPFSATSFYRHSTSLLIFAHTCICLLSIVINSASAQCLWATTIHPPPVFPPLHHQSVVLLCAKIFFLFYLRLTCIMFCQLLSESFEFFWVVSKFFLFPKFFFFNIGFLHVHMCSFFCLGLWGLSPKGGVLSWLVTGSWSHITHLWHFRPFLGSHVKVTHMTSKSMYIVSHTKGTYFP